ncbi:MAG: biopolymer transporter ExbD [Spirochaetes bacterium]|nr:biopolymer transporter ExbD [Spirochaetota bacterium]
MKVQSFLRKIKPIAIGTSMADLALLLLVFFMASTSTEPPPGVEVNLPFAETQGAEQESIYITVSRDGELYYDGRKATLQEIYDNLAMRHAEKDKIVSITADKNLEYQKVAEVLSILRSQDFLNIVFMAQSHQTGEKK